MNPAIGRYSPAAAAVLFFGLAACKAPPARLVAGVDDTVVVNNLQAVQMPMHVFDAAGHELPDTGIHFQWTSGVAIPVSSHGVVTCTQAGDATLRASLGSLVTSVALQCRPVHDVRGGGPLNLVLGDPPHDLPFAAVDATGLPVKPLRARFEIGDSTILAREGWRIRARRAGESYVRIAVGDSSADWGVHVYAPALTFEGIQPGQHLAVQVRLGAGEMRSWLLPASPKNYSVQWLPDRDPARVPRLAIVGANCDPERWGYVCVTLRGASVIAYHPRNVEPTREWRGTIAVVRHDRP